MNKRLKEIKARVKASTPEPTGDEEDTCAECGGSVLVRDGSDWEDGDLCDICAQDYLDYYREDVPYLLEQLWRALDVIEPVSKFACASPIECQELIWICDSCSARDLLKSLKEGDA